MLRWHVGRDSHVIDGQPIILCGRDVEILGVLVRIAALQRVAKEMDLTRSIVVSRGLG